MSIKRGDFSTNGRILLIGTLALTIGGIASFVALGLIKLINFFTNLFFYGSFSFNSASPANHHLGMWVIVIPAFGGLVIGLMARFGSEKIRGHGIPEALEAILFGKSIMNPKVAILKPLSSAISIGSGGPFGAEGPIIMTGGAVGSLLAQAFHLTAAERKALLVSGAAAGMSAIFASPIAAIFLAVELLLFEWRPRSLIPVAIASIVASLLRPLLLGSGPVFPFEAHVSVTGLGLASCVVVGLIAGFFSFAVSTLLYKAEDGFHKLPFHWMWWCVIGGFVVGVGGYFQPLALGVGYEVIEGLLKGDILLKAAATILSVKVIIWTISLASGTSGGVLAPLLMMGCGLGVLEANFLSEDFRPLYPLVSMAAVMGGMMRAPFTAVMFALELTHNTDSMVPAMTATIVAYAVTVTFMKRSILTEKVARRGFDIFREYGVDSLETTQVSEVMTKNVTTIPGETPMDRVKSLYFSPDRKFRGYPIVNTQGHLSGMLTATDILDYSTNSPIDQTAGELGKEVLTIYAHQSCREAVEKMAAFGIGRLPVVPVENPQLILGIITRSDLLKPHVTRHESEMIKERILF